MMPLADYNKLYKKILENTDCFKYAQLPDFTFCDCEK